MTAITRPDTILGFGAVVLENRLLRATVIPELGGRIWELEDRIRGRQWIWHRADVPLARTARDASYDDVWAGGWEELFPNDAPGSFEGRLLPDHGEWWATAWQAADCSDDSGAGLRLTAEMSVIRASCVKEIRLDVEEPMLTVSYRIRSHEDRPFHFLFKQHLPVALTPGCRLQLPGGRVRPVDPEFSSLVATGAEFDWPLAPGRDGAIDLRNVPSEREQQREFLYVRDLPRAWCGVDDISRGASIRMHFDREKLPYVWLFLSYGGWRNLYTGVLEPCTNLPKDLADAARLRQAARLEPDQEFATRVSVTLTETAIAPR